MDNVFLKPALAPDGKPMIVPDEHSHRPLKADGEWKPLTSYWARRIRDLDVTEAQPPSEATQPDEGELAPELREQTPTPPARRERRS